MFGNEIDLQETESGHYSIPVDLPRKSVKEDATIKDQEELLFKNVVAIPRPLF